MAKPPGMILTTAQRRQLRAAREKLGLSQGELAERCECDRVTIVTLETGLRPVSQARIFAVARALGLKPRIELAG